MTQPPPMSDFGMVAVTKESFYATVGRLDVHPSIAGQKWDDVMGYKETWKLRDGTVVGLSYGRPNCVYGVTQAYYNANKDKLVRA